MGQLAWWLQIGESNQVIAYNIGWLHNIIHMACQIVAAHSTNLVIFHIQIECGHYLGTILTNKGPH